MTKKFYLLLIVAALLLGNNLPVKAQAGRNIPKKEKETDYFNPETWLLGYFDQKEFLTDPHFEWFDKEFDSYQIDDEAIVDLVSIEHKDLTILIVLGTWCPDSRREVPRFLKIMDIWGLGSDQITFLGVDSYKNAPIDEYKELEIDRVPTFIIYRNKNEAGRIIEYPKASLERDMVNILGKIRRMNF